MSLDYPEYLELKKRKQRLLAFLWRVGDIGYYVGLLGALIGPLCIFWIFIESWLRGEPGRSFWSAMQGGVTIGAIVFVAFALILILSGELKARVLKRSKRAP